MDLDNFVLKGGVAGTGGGYKSTVLNQCRFK